MFDVLNKVVGLDIVCRSRFPRIQFAWSTRVPVELGGMRLRQVNTVVLLHVTSRLTGALCLLTPDEVDYTLISGSADPKFKSQRSMWTGETTSFFYFSGKVLVVGGETRLHAMAGAYMSSSVLCNYRRQGRPEFVIGGLKVVNTVVHGQLGRTLDESEMRRMSGVKLDGMGVRYEPDLFSGVVIAPEIALGRMDVDGTTLYVKTYTTAPPEAGTITIYQSGQFILAGTTDTPGLHAALQRLDYVLAAATTMQQ